MKIKTLKQIVTDLIQWTISKTNKITDFNVGSVIRTLYESIAAEIEEIYYHLWNGFRDSVKNAIFYSFDFHYLEPTPATATLTFTRLDENDTTIPINIPAGTVVATEEGIYFTTLSDCVIPIGETSTTVTAQSQLTGSNMNVLENTINIVVTPDLQSSITVTNPEPATGGTDQETDEEIKERFGEYIKSLAKGTLSALEYGAKTVQGVLNATAVDHYLGIVDLYVWDTNGELSDTLKSQVEAEIENWRAGGIQVKVHAPNRKTVSVTLKVQVSDLNYVDTNSLSQKIIESVKAITSEIKLGKSLNISEIISTAMSVSPYIVDVKVTQPTEDVTAETYEVIIISDVTISEITDEEI